MKRFNEKGASLGFCITLALLAAIIICALFVSCGRARQSGVRSLESGVKDKNGNTSASVFDSGLKTQDSGLPLADALRQIDAYPAPAGVDAARFATLKAELKRLLTERAQSTSPVGVDLRVDPAVKRADTQVRPYARTGSDRAEGNRGTAGGDAGSTSSYRRPGTLARQHQPPDRSVGPPGNVGDAKSSSIAPTGTMNAVTDLKATVNPAASLATLTWTEALPGDYDNNGVVDIADLIPVALYYGQRTDSGPDDPHRLVNGDFNPEINIWDLGVIAGNYAAHLQGYQVWRGHFNGTTTDWEPAFRPNTNPANPNWSADRPSPPPVSTRPSYTYADDINGLADKNNVRYKGIAYGDGAPGAESNEAVPPSFSVSGTVTQSGLGLPDAKITVSPGGLSALTNTDGTYAITGVPNGAYTLTPTKAGYSFSPPSLAVTVNGADETRYDFTATPGGLANSAWPKFAGNARNTGLSPYVGSPRGILKWSTMLTNLCESSPVIGPDGTIYIGWGPSGMGVPAGSAPVDGRAPRRSFATSSTDFGAVYAFYPANGGVKWQHGVPLGYVYAAPAVGYDGTIYACTSHGEVLALNPEDGGTRWSQAVGGYGAPAIDADGTVYVGGGDKVTALNPADGSIKWTSPAAGFNSPAAIGADGTVYVSGTNGVYAMNPVDGSVKWLSATVGSLSTPPALRDDGTLYVGGDKLWALNGSDGALLWEQSPVQGPITALAIGPGGTVYSVAYGNVEARDATTGSLKWRYSESEVTFVGISVGADGTVYAGAAAGSWGIEGRVYALSSSGTMKWYCLAGGPVFSFPSIGADGTVYAAWTDVGWNRSAVFALGGPNTFVIYGTVTKAAGLGMGGVTMTLSPIGLTAMTQANGKYQFGGIPNGTYSISPSMPGYSFRPPSSDVVVSGGDVYNQDFTST